MTRTTEGVIATQWGTFLWSAAGHPADAHAGLPRAWSLAAPGDPADAALGGPGARPDGLAVRSSSTWPRPWSRAWPWGSRSTTRSTACSSSAASGRREAFRESLFDSYAVTGPGVLLSSLAVAVGFAALRAQRVRARSSNFGTMVGIATAGSTLGQPRAPARLPDARRSLGCAAGAGGGAGGRKFERRVLPGRLMKWQNPGPCMGRTDPGSTVWSGLGDAPGRSGGRAAAANREAREGQAGDRGDGHGGGLGHGADRQDDGIAGVVVIAVAAEARAPGRGPADQREDLVGELIRGLPELAEAVGELHLGLSPRQGRPGRAGSPSRGRSGRTIRRPRHWKRTVPAGWGSRSR